VRVKDASGAKSQDVIDAVTALGFKCEKAAN
jgi:hypothetical protein